MLRLMYFSTATSDMSRNDLDAIIDQAARRNSRSGVTGLLAFNGRNFCQVLEGEEATVRDLIEKIRVDARHAGFKILAQKAIAKRHFDGWALKKVDALDFSEAVTAMEA